MSPTRLVAVTAAGVLAWMTQDQRSPERDVLEHLVSGADTPAVDLQALALRQGWGMAELGRVLFALNRARAIRVVQNPSDVRTEAAAPSLTGMQHDLQEMAGPGHCALLLDQEGLCIAAIGCPAARADELAAQHVAGRQTLAVQATLRFAHARVSVLSSVSLPQEHPAWVRLVRRLLPWGGAMVSHGAAIP